MTDWKEFAGKLGAAYKTVTYPLRCCPPIFDRKLLYHKNSSQIDKKSREKAMLFDRHTYYSSSIDQRFKWPDDLFS
jgi:hypothetical protein